MLESEQFFNSWKRVHLSKVEYWKYLQVRNPVDRFLSAFEEIMSRLVPPTAVNAIKNNIKLWQSSFDRPPFLSELTAFHREHFRKTFLAFVDGVGKQVTRRIYFTRAVCVLRPWECTWHL